MSLSAGEWCVDTPNPEGIFFMLIYLPADCESGTGRAALNEVKSKYSWGKSGRGH